MDFPFASAGPSNFHHEEQPCTSSSLALPEESMTTMEVDNIEWRVPSHLAHVLNDNARTFIYNRTDPSIQLDMRSFYNMMAYEETLQPNYHYFTAVQEHVTPFHREQAIDWIYDVAREENCDGDVLLLAVALIDRFLSVQNVLKHDIQMIAGVSLFIASKLKAPHPLTASKIAYYSDNSCSVEMILQWELLIVTTLQWETESPTAFSFFDQLAARIPQIHNLRVEFQTVVQKCQRMHKLATLFPSMQCAIGLYYVSHLPHQSPELAVAIKNLLGNMFQLEVNLLDSYIPMVQRCLNPAPIYAPEEVEKPKPTSAETEIPEVQEEVVIGQADVEAAPEEPEEEEEPEFDNDNIFDQLDELDGLYTPPYEEEEHEGADEEILEVLEVVQQESPVERPQELLLEKIPISDQTPLTPLNDSGFSSDVSSPASSEKKRRRSCDWYEDDITPPKIFKAF